MAFGIIRIRNLKKKDLKGTDLHNARKYETLEEYPENIDPTKPHKSTYHQLNSENSGDEFGFPKGENATLSTSAVKNLSTAVQDRIEKKGVEHIRKNTNVAIEYVCTISDKKAWNNYTPEAFFSNTKDWLEERHGKGSVVASYEHKDESNPHVHFIVVPIIKKTVKWKNKSGKGERIENRLNASDYTGGPKKLRKLQDDFFKHLVDTYGKGGEDGYSKLGVPLYRGTLVEHQTRVYADKTNHKIALLAAEISELTGETVKSFLEIELALQKRLKEVTEAKQKELIEEQKRKKAKNWKKRGTRDNPEIFHGETSKSPRKRPKL